MKRGSFGATWAWVALLWLVCAPGSAVAQDNDFLPTPDSRAELDALEAIEDAIGTPDSLTLSDRFLMAYPESELTHLVRRVRVQTYVQMGDHQSTVAEAESALVAESAFYDSRLAAIEDAVEDPGFPEFEHEFMNARTDLYQSMMNAYGGLGDSARMAEYGELAVENADRDWESYGPSIEGDPAYEEVARAHEDAQFFFLQRIMAAYQNANDVDKLMEYARRVLALDSRNLNSLLVISTVMAESPPADESDRQEHFEDAESYARDALEVLENFLGSPAGAQLGDAQKANLLSTAHSTLGTIHFQMEEFGDAQREFRSSVEVVPDPLIYFSLGLAYFEDEEIEDAMAALARSVFLGGSTEAQAREMLERLYEFQNDSLDGLDAYIQSEGGGIDAQ